MDHKTYQCTIARAESRTCRSYGKGAKPIFVVDPKALSLRGERPIDALRADSAAAYAAAEWVREEAERQKILAHEHWEVTVFVDVYREHDDRLEDVYCGQYVVRYSGGISQGPRPSKVLG